MFAPNEVCLATWVVAIGDVFCQTHFTDEKAKAWQWGPGAQATE